MSVQINPAEQSSSSGHPVRRAALVAEVQNAFVASVAESIATIESGGDAFAVAEIGADAYAMAIAQALATFIIELDSTPADPTPCVQAEANTQTNAEVFARILVEVRHRHSSDTHRTNSFFCMKDPCPILKRYRICQCGRGFFGNCCGHRFRIRIGSVCCLRIRRLQRRYLRRCSPNGIGHSFRGGHYFGLCSHHA